jgi:outer membrane lipoprotein carrier protein
VSIFSALKAIGVVLFCALATSVAVAEPVTGKAVPEQLDRALNQMAETPGISCEFLQIVYFSDGGEQRYSGTLSISRPGRFHWKYLMPYEQLYVSDGNGVWHYEADLMQAERLQSLDAVDPVVMKLLDGRVSRNTAMRFLK